jgi:two-component system NtrC family sensor kinase
MRHLRLFTKTLAILLLLFAITALTTAGFSAWVLERNLREQYVSKGSAIATGIAGSSVEMLLFRDAATIQAMLDQYQEEGKIQGVEYVFVVNEGGEIVSHTFTPGIPPEVQQLEGDRHRTKVQRLAIAGRGDVIDISAPILASEVGYVHVGMDADLIRTAILAAIAQQLGLMALLFLGSIVVAYFLVGQLAQPLQRLTEYAQRIASDERAKSDSGEIAALVPIIEGTDEVGQLALAFRQMIVKLATREQGLRQAQDEMRLLNETLEQRVAERSAAVAARARELADANQHLQEEIAERKQAEAELMQERYLLRTLMDNVPDSIYFKDTQSRFTRINRSLASRFGLADPTGAIGKTDFDYFTEEHARPAFEDEQEMLRSGSALVGKEEKETWEDGRERWVLTTKMPLCDQEGAIVGTFGISRDVTRRKQAQLALEASERRYRQLMEASLDAIVVADEEQRILLFNPAAERIFGYAAGEIVGQPLNRLVPPEYFEAHEHGFRRFKTQRQGRIVGSTIELRGRRQDGSEFPIELSISALDLGGELQFLGAIRDLTERNRLRAMMVQTEKLASIGQLSAGVAHEINNPLAFVANNLVVLQRDVKGIMALVDTYDSARGRLAEADPEAARKAAAQADEMDLPYVRDNIERLLTRTRDGVQRVTQIVHSMRNLARTAAPDFQETQIGDLVNMGLEMLGGQLRRANIHVELDYDPAATKVNCMPTQLAQVLLNMIVNAMQAIEAASRPEGRIRVASRSVGSELLIEISDNGCGIAAQDRSRLFDPFFTTKPVGEGTGLGLSIAHGIVTGHGGRIEVESEQGQGACFRIYLPCHLEDAPHALVL